jgi:transposase
VRMRHEIRRLEQSLCDRGAENEKLRDENEQLKQRIEKLEAELKALRQPPKWVKPNVDSENRRKKKLGPKFGHTPHPRTTPERVDREVALVPKHCPDCGDSLPKPSKWHTHTQVDLPPPARAITTRYHVGWAYCKGCKKQVPARNQLSGSKYGPRLHAQVCYWKFSLGLTLGKIHSLLIEQHQLEISTGVLSQMLTRSAKQFDGAYADLAAGLSSQPHLHADETGWRNDGNNAWLWSFSNADVSYYVIDRSRGSQVVENVLGQAYSGILVSDFYGGYHAIECEKQKCWTHVLRDLRELKKKYPKNSEIKDYSRRMKWFYRRALGMQGRHQAGQDVEVRWRKLRADTHSFIFRTPRHPDLVCLSKRLRKHRNELYVFVRTNHVGGTNNAAEREIRPAVLMRKTSYGNRSDQGTENQAILMSMIRTAKKRGMSFTKMASSYFCS